MVFERKIKVDLRARSDVKHHPIAVVLPELVSRVTAGTSVCDLCQFGDDLINAQASIIVYRHVIMLYTDTNSSFLGGALG